MSNFLCDQPQSDSSFATNCCSCRSGLCDKVFAPSQTSIDLVTITLHVLQIPSWWVHKGAQPAIEPLKGTKFMEEDGRISFYNIVEAQLAGNATSVWLPKYLLVLYQLTL